jgi:hypothetical protein
MKLYQVRNGVKMGEGDGTVSLLSLGAMCVEGWKRPRWNPAGIKITTVEVSVQISLLNYMSLKISMGSIFSCPIALFPTCLVEELIRATMLIF